MENIRSLTHAYHQAPWRKQIQWIGTFLLVLVVVWLVAAIYLDITARAAAIGREIQRLQVGGGLTLSVYDDITLVEEAPSIEELEQQIATLQLQLAMLTSKSAMDGRAAEMGYHPVSPSDVLYIEIPGYIPPQQPQLAPPPGSKPAQSQSTVPVIRESMLQWLIGQLLQAGQILEGAQP